MANTAGSKTIAAPPTPKARRGFKNYWNEVGRELKKVDWPPVKEVNRLTFVVLAVCAFVVLVLWAMSYVAGTVITLLQQGRVG